MKPHKAFSKRIRITKRGKLIRRVAGQNHFNSKESRRIQRRKSRGAGISPTLERTIRSYLAR